MRLPASELTMKNLHHTESQTTNHFRLQPIKPPTIHPKANSYLN
jgi:hypothetical protein